MKVLIVDDSAFMRKAIGTMLESDPDIQVVGKARNGKEGLELAKSLQPDVITMDIEMPEMDGLTALRRIMSECPANVLMFSSLTKEGSAAALTALRLGAADVLAKEQSQISTNIMSMQSELIAKVKALGAAHRHRKTLRQTAMNRTVCLPPTFKPGQFDLVCIGSSTGGPPVLETVLTALPADFSAPIVVAQHMPEMFTRSMAERFATICKMPVVHVEDGMAVQRRTIHICPGSHNTHISRIPGTSAQFRLTVNQEPKTAIYKPSVDALLESAATASGARTLAVVLTGMGDDGLRGARPLHAKGGVLMAQSAETCVVYGMPKAVTENGLIIASLTPTQIAKALGSLSPSGAMVPPVTHDSTTLRKAG